MANLTGNDIKDTYSKLLQKDGSTIQDGLGNTVNVADIYATQISGSFTKASASLAQDITSLQINTSSLATTGSNIFIGNQTTTGSVTITGSVEIYSGRQLLRRTQERYSLISQTDNGVDGVVSVQTRTNDQLTHTKIYGHDVDLGLFRTQTLTIGNTGSYTSITGNEVIISGSTLLTGSIGVVGDIMVTGSIKINGSSLLTLRPLNPLPSSPETGTLAVTGSTLAFYDGNNWKAIMTGSILL